MQHTLAIINTTREQTISIGGIKGLFGSKQGPVGTPYNHAHFAITIRSIKWIKETGWCQFNKVGKGLIIAESKLGKLFLNLFWQTGKHDFALFFRTGDIFRISISC